MALYINNKKISKLCVNGQFLSKLYKNGKLIYQSDASGGVYKLEYIPYDDNGEEQELETIEIDKGPTGDKDCSILAEYLEQNVNLAYKYLKITNEKATCSKKGFNIAINYMNCDQTNTQGEGITDLSEFNVSNIKDFSNLFNYGSIFIDKLILFKTPGAINMSHMFDTFSAYSLDFSNFDTSKVTDMSYMFSGVGTYPPSIIDLDLTNFDLGSVQDMSHMFDYSSMNEITFGLKAYSPNLRNLSHAFDSAQIENLDLSNFSFSNVEDMSYMFYFCENLQKTTFPHDAKKIKNMEGMFYYCTNLTDIDMSEWDLSYVNNIKDTFLNCSVENLKFGHNLGKGYTKKQELLGEYGIYIDSWSLTKESVEYIIENVYDLNLTYDGELYTQELSFSSYSDAEYIDDKYYEMATQKGWTITIE